MEHGIKLPLADVEACVNTSNPFHVCTPFCEARRNEVSIFSHFATIPMELIFCLLLLFVVSFVPLSSVIQVFVVFFFRYPSYLMAVLTWCISNVSYILFYFSDRKENNFTILIFTIIFIENWYCFTFSHQQ